MGDDGRAQGAAEPLFLLLEHGNGLRPDPRRHGYTGVPGLERVQACSAVRSSTLRRRVSGSLSPSTLRYRNCKTGTSTGPCNCVGFLILMRRPWRLACASFTQRTTYVSLHVPTATGDPPLRISISRAGLNWRTVDMRADQKCPTFDPLFPTRRLARSRAPRAPARAPHPPAMWPAASPSAAAQRPSATMGPTPGITDGDRRGEVRRSSPRRDAVGESSISEPGEAPPASARAPSSPCVRATMDTRSRGMPSVRRSLAAAAAAEAS